jgi:hypothetical protein
MTIIKFPIVFLLLLLLNGIASAEPVYKPYIRANVTPAEVKDQLKAHQFEIIGEYKPFDDVVILIVTSDALKQAAAVSEFGGYGVIQRVAISNEQIFYTNPTYMAYVYRMSSDLADVTSQLKEALGNKGEFGSKAGLTESQLRQYKYMWGMPNFEDQLELAEHPSYEKAISTVETGLKTGKGGTKFIYRIDIPNKEETVFGMALTDGEGADETIIKTLEKVTHVAYMPYELLVSSNKVYMLHGRFRIAISFPDLRMRSFIKIRKAPSAIEKAAKIVAQSEE